MLAFLGKITRNLAISKYRHNSSLKRGGGQVDLALEELEECIPDQNTTEQAVSDKLFVERLNIFLEEEAISYDIASFLNFFRFLTILQIELIYKNICYDYRKQSRLCL